MSKLYPDYRYVVYSEAELDFFFKGVRKTDLSTPLFTDDSGKANEYVEDHPNTTIHLVNNIFRTNLLEIIEMKDYLELQEKSYSQVINNEKEPVTPKKKRGRPVGSKNKTKHNA